MFVRISGFSIEVRQIAEAVSFSIAMCLLISRVDHRDNVKYYGLHIAEDDGEVDWVFPCLDPKETVSKFVFKMLALVEKSGDEQESDKHSAVETWEIWFESNSS